ncbi:VOC family protein [Micrococcales bacterium 31B]|nr:VOC family protein [Micrococcales bacterium 31B]
MEFTNGSPIWMDLSTSDLPGALKFYGDLFGWEFADTGEDFGHYNMASSEGKMVAGIGPKMPGQEGAPDCWTLYFKTTDIEATMAAITEAGGSNAFEPAMVIGDSGSMAIGNDGEAFFGLWQPNQHQGFEKIGTNSMVWCEMSTRDPERVKPFYSKVLGFTYLEGVPPMTMFATPDAAEGTFSGGVFDHSEVVPEGVPDHWMIYIACENINDVVSKTTAAGGEVLVEPTEIEYGTFAVLRDPWGATFSSIAMNPDMGQ